MDVISINNEVLTLIVAMSEAFENVEPLLESELEDIVVFGELIHIYKGREIITLLNIYYFAWVISEHCIEYQFEAVQLVLAERQSQLAVKHREYHFMHVFFSSTGLNHF